ncbi:MAG: M23 family metallopeptidase [Spirochaetia bacterium]
MKRRLELVVALSVIALVGTGAKSASAQEFASVPDTVEQGAPSVFLVDWPATDEDSVRGGASGGEELGRKAFLSLESASEGRVLSTECFPADQSDVQSAEQSRWACIAGVPSTLDPGDYSVTVVLGSPQGTTELEHSLEVVSRDFNTETISLNRDLTKMRSEPDPRKAEEAKSLRELVATFRPDAVYHRGPFVIPVEDGRRTSDFGDRRTYRYVDGASAGAVHYGIDIAADTGTPVRAGGGGRVVMVADRVISGTTVVIEHLPGVYGLHYHLDSASVSEGDIVEARDVIGEVGASGLATGAHLHWEVRVSGVPVEPEELLSTALIDIEANSENIGVEVRSQEGR